MLNYMSPEMVRLLQAERERELAEDRVAAALRAARARCGGPIRGTSRLLQTLRLAPPAPCCC